MAYEYKRLKINGKCIDEHRYVWIQHYGEIPNDCVIHHKDGDKRNNDISNLECVTRKSHSKGHFNPDIFNTDECKEKVKESLKNSWKNRQEHIPDGYSQCSKCRQVLPLDKFHKHAKEKRGVFSQCKECRAKYRVS